MYANHFLYLHFDLRRSDFRNPADPNDKSFEADPDNYPVAELEYPNTGAKERSVLLHIKHLSPSTFNRVTGLFFLRPKTKTTITQSWI
jgi:hypothetical protein